MSDILNRNLNLLEKHQPRVYQKLMHYLKGQYTPQNNSVERILLARHEDLVINMLVVCNQKEYIICDHEDPIGQSYAWIDKYTDPANKADIVFGMGFGFHLEVLLTGFKNKKVIIIEPNIELFYRILEVRNLELIIQKSELFVDEAIDVILKRVHALFWDTEQGGIQCQPFEVYGEMFETLWDDLRSKFIKQAENFTVDIATRKCFGELWIHNNIKNARKMTGASNAGGLVGKFQGTPGILVSAGPSLSKNVHLLNELKDKCVIVAAGTAVNILEKNGITPHFMVGIDAGEAEVKRHKDVISKDIYFVYSNQVAAGSVDVYGGPKFLMNFPVDMYTAEFFEFAGIKSEFLLSGPSVANTCFDMLLKMGCDPIILVGQDLAFTEGSMYAGDAQGSLLDKAENKGYILTQDIYGNDVYTQAPFVAMKNWFEGYFEKVKNKVEIINATEGGLNIQFAANDRLENVISGRDFNAQNIGERIRQIYDSSRFPEKIDDKLNKYVEIINLEIKKLEELSKSQLKLADLIKRDIYHPSKDKKAFDRLVNQIGEFTDRVIEAPIYRSLLANLVEIDFYLIKLEVDRATKNLSRYSEVKDIYINAIEKQNKMLEEKLARVKSFLAEG